MDRETLIVVLTIQFTAQVAVVEELLRDRIAETLTSRNSIHVVSVTDRVQNSKC